MKKISLMLLAGFCLLNAGVVSAKNEVKAQNRNVNLATPSATQAQKRELETERVREKNGAQFSLSNGQVTLVTPSGNTHELKLPEQAIENMQRNGFFDKQLEASEPAVTQTVKHQKKLLGLIPVKLDMDLSIDTNSGEVSYLPKSLWARMLKFLFTE